MNSVTDKQAADEKLAEWQKVATRVEELLPKAHKIKRANDKVALTTGIFGAAVTTWEPDTDTLRVYTSDFLQKKAAYKYIAAAKDNETLSGFKVYFCNVEPKLEKEIIIKRATEAVKGNNTSMLGSAFNYGHKALGGPNPLSNALITGLTAGGLGYGAGAILENLFPERYVERGPLRRTLALLGGGVGLGLGAGMAGANQKALGGNYFKHWLTPSDALEKQRALEEKTAFADTGLMAPSIDVRRMNDAIWDDARKGLYEPGGLFTPVPYAATASGLLTGISAGLQSPIIRPVDVIRGIASAGVGLATATSAGKMLAALAGITPAAQETIQNIGLWGGVMHAIVPPMLGMR